MNRLQPGPRLLCIPSSASDSRKSRMNPDHVSRCPVSLHGFVKYSCSDTAVIKDKKRDLIEERGRTSDLKSSLLCNGLKELELLAEYRWKDDWNDEALDEAFEAGTQVHLQGNLDVGFLSLL